MRCRRDTTWFWNTGQKKTNFLMIYFLLCCFNQGWARPDFLDTMSRQFFGMSSDNNEQPQQQYQSSPDPFMEMFGSSNQQVSQKSPPPPNYQHSNRHSSSQPHRQGYYPPPHVVQQVAHPHVIQQHVHQPHLVQQHVHPAHQQQIHPPYNGPPPVYGQQQGFGQRRPDTNETKTEGFPPDNAHHKHPHHLRHPYPAVDYQTPHHNQQVVAVEYPKPPATVIEYQTPYPQHSPQQVEYHHIPQQPVVVEEHSPALEIHTGNEHTYHEPPTHVEYHHPPEEEYHHHPPPHKPKGFHISFNQPSPDYKIIDRHIKLPPVKFRFHINPKIVITSNTKDPLDKKHHHDDHDLEPYPPPDAFSDHNAPPSLNKHVIEHYPVKHHYPVEHHAVNQYAVGYPEPNHHYAVGHEAVAHHPPQEYVYDLSHGHSHLNPHRSLGHYEPTFKVKTKPIIFTEPPPTPPTTTTRATTTTARTTTARTTTTTTARPTRRARISARNPAFSVAFTQASTTATEASTTPSTTTRRSIFRTNSERERENDGISARRDEVSTSAESPQSTKSTTTSTTTSTTSTTPKSTSTTSTTPTPSTNISTSAATQPITTTTTTTTPRTTTTSTTTTTTTTTTQKPTTTTTTTTTVKPTTTTTTTTTSKPTIRSRVSPAEETTVRSTTYNVDANEIEMRKTTETPRRRPEPLLKESSSIERSSLDIIESSESVKVIETTMLIDGKNQTVRFYYITHPVKLPLDVFQKMTGQSKDKPSGVNVIKIRDKRYAVLNQNFEPLQNL